MLPRLKRLESLGCFPQVLEKLKAGESIPSVTKFVMETGEAFDLKERTISDYLRHWCRENASRMRTYRVPTQNMFIGSAEDIDPVQALNTLFHIQLDRVRLFCDREHATKEHIRHNNESIRLAKDLAKEIHQMKLQSERSKILVSSGVDRDEQKSLEQMETVKQAYTERYGDKAAAVVLNPESRRKVFTALQKVRRGDSAQVLKLLSENDAELKGIEEEQQKEDAKV